MVSVTVPGGVVGDFTEKVGEEEFECQILAQYADRLYCIGPEPSSGDEANIVIYATGREDPLFEALFAIPRRPSGSDNGGGPTTVVVSFGGALGNNYSPSSITVNVGDTVEWRGDFSIHPLVSDNGLWGTEGGGSTFSFTFNSPGTFDYHCQVHQALGMTGDVTVIGP